MSTETTRQSYRFAMLAQGLSPEAADRVMSLVEEAGIPHVPATVVARLPLKSLLDFKNGQDPAVRETMDAMERANALLDEDSMLRWDPCGGFGLKA